MQKINYYDKIDRSVVKKEGGDEVLAAESNLKENEKLTKAMIVMGRKTELVYRIAEELAELWSAKKDNWPSADLGRPELGQRVIVRLVLSECVGYEAWLELVDELKKRGVQKVASLYIIDENSEQDDEPKMICSTEMSWKAVKAQIMKEDRGE